MNMRSVIAADGRARRLFTVGDVERMVEAGIVEPDERLEIVDGEILPMSPKGSRHEVLKQYLNVHLARTLPADVKFIPEAGWKLSDLLYLEPDFLVFPAVLSIDAVRGPDALLVIEVADSTLGTDLGFKAGLYAREGVREYWVVDAALRETHVHLHPRNGGYAAVRAYPAEVELVPELIRDFKVRIADLPLA